MKILATWVVVAAVLATGSSWAAPPLGDLQDIQESIQVDRPPQPALRSRGLRADYQPLPKPEPAFDVLHYRLDMDFPAAGLLRPEFQGVLSVTLKPFGSKLSEILLDSDGLDIQGVEVLGQDAPQFHVMGDVLMIHLARSLKQDEQATLQIRYAWTQQRDAGVFFRSRPGRKVGAGGFEALYSHSEATESRFWFPSNSHPTDRATWEARINVPAPYTAVSNGKLLSAEKGADGRTLFHWKTGIPMVSYLHVATVGDFGKTTGEWEGVPLEYYGLSDDMDRVSYSLRNTPGMLALFRDLTGLKYPYEKYAQVVVPRYLMGGMEHASATTLTQNTVHDSRYDEELWSDPLVSHELAHQWFGDYVTCRTWDHLWLNEGFATYFDALWEEHARGPEALYRYNRSSADGYYAQEDQDPRPVVLAYYRNGLNDYFDAHSYNKGGLVLHMLRRELGDATFFAGIQRYLREHPLALVTTEDFRASMEREAGRELGWFFDQWLYKPGYPRFQTSWSYDGAAKELVLNVTQTQDVSVPGGVAGLVPYFEGSIPVGVDGTVHRVRLAKLKQQTLRIPYDFQPGFVEFNAGDDWVAKLSEEQPLTSWAAQLVRSPQLSGRVKAAWALAEKGIAATEAPELTRSRVSTLTYCVTQDTVATVRADCVRALAKLSANTVLPTAGRELAQAAYRTVSGLALADGDWKLRDAVAKTADALPGPEAGLVLRHVLADHRFLLPRVSALATIARAPFVGAYEVVTAQLDAPQEGERVRAEALRTLTALADIRALPLAQQYAGSGYEDRTRDAAFALLVRLGKAQVAVASEPARAVLEDALADIHHPTRRRAATALGDLGNKQALGKLRKLAESDPDASVREAAKAAIEKLGG
jgi:aminopeptidase N